MVRLKADMKHVVIWTIQGSFGLHHDIGHDQEKKLMEALEDRINDTLDRNKQAI